MAGIVRATSQTARTMVHTASCIRAFGNSHTTLTQVRFVKCPSSPDAVKQDIDELKEKAAAVANKAEEAIGVETIAEKAKKSAQEGWNATKDAATKVQNTVTREAQASAATVKDHMEVAKESMNTKK